MGAFQTIGTHHVLGLYNSRVLRGQLALLLFDRLPNRVVYDLELGNPSYAPLFSRFAPRHPPAGHRVLNATASPSLWGRAEASSTRASAPKRCPFMLARLSRLRSTPRLCSSRLVIATIISGVCACSYVAVRNSRSGKSAQNCRSAPAI